MALFIHLDLRYGPLQIGYRTFFYHEASDLLAWLECLTNTFNPPAVCGVKWDVMHTCVSQDTVMFWGYEDLFTIPEAQKEKATW